MKKHLAETRDRSPFANPDRPTLFGRNRQSRRQDHSRWQRGPLFWSLFQL